MKGEGVISSVMVRGRRGEAGMSGGKNEKTNENQKQDQKVS